MDYVIHQASIPLLLARREARIIASPTSRTLRSAARGREDSRAWCSPIVIGHVDRGVAPDQSIQPIHSRVCLHKLMARCTCNFTRLRLESRHQATARVLPAPVSRLPTPRDLVLSGAERGKRSRDLGTADKPATTYVRTSSTGAARGGGARVAAVGQRRHSHRLSLNELLATLKNFSDYDATVYRRLAGRVGASQAASRRRKQVDSIHGRGREGCARRSTGSGILQDRAHGAACSRHVSSKLKHHDHHDRPDQAAWSISSIRRSFPEWAADGQLLLRENRHALYPDDRHDGHPPSARCRPLGVDAPGQQRSQDADDDRQL